MDFLTHITFQLDQLITSLERRTEMDFAILLRRISVWSQNIENNLRFQQYHFDFPDMEIEKEIIYFNNKNILKIEIFSRYYNKMRRLGKNGQRMTIGNIIPDSAILLII